MPLAAPGNSSAAPAASGSDGSLAGNNNGNGEGEGGEEGGGGNNATAVAESDDSSAALPTPPPSEPTATVEGVEDMSPATPARPTVVSVSPEVARAGEALMVVGTGFGEAVADVRVMVGGRDCRDPELCHLVCRPCGDEDRCEFDEMCMEDGLSKEKVMSVVCLLFVCCLFVVCLFVCLSGVRAFCAEKVL